MAGGNGVEHIRVIDSHTAGEPTRVVVSGGPNLGTGSLAERREWLRKHHDHYRSAIVNEPRGSDVLVGAYLCEPVDPSCVAGVIFFNNVGYLGMCGHGTMGVAVTLAHLGRIGPGTHRLETPVGVVSFDYDGSNRVAIENVASRRIQANRQLQVEGLGTVTGDVAWGGNLFFLVTNNKEWLERANIPRLVYVTGSILSALHKEDVPGVFSHQSFARPIQIDHIELYGPANSPENHSRSFVLCPGGAYDRSPCGTGTSAKLACLYADGKLKEGEIYRQESIIGSVFEGSVRIVDGQIIPRIVGSAYVTGESLLILDPADPFRLGIR